MFKMKQTHAYLFFGVLTTLISVVIYQGLSRLNAGVAVSNTVSTVVSVLFAFFTNKYYVFKSKEQKNLIAELFKFIAARVATYLVETGLLIILVERLMFDSLICKIGTTGLVIVLNYFLSKYAVFK